MGNDIKSQIKTVADDDIALGQERDPGSNSLSHGKTLDDLGPIYHPGLLTRDKIRGNFIEILNPRGQVGIY